MKHLLTLTLFLGIAWGQKELRGYWHRTDGDYIYLERIYKSNGRQFVEYTTYNYDPLGLDLNVWGKDPSSVLTKILYDPWFGESYTEHTNSTRTIKTEYILIDKNTLLRGQSKYKRGRPSYLPSINN